ncbi:hypothetical protein [Zoogloea sp.]|uniref:hypothetical protein n=1 Tax=Zoogloea sp. TaxID=49181 RepID=UPI0035AE98E3
MKVRTVVVGSVSALLLNACGFMNVKDPDEKIASVSEVLNLVKDEITVYRMTEAKVQPNTGTCYDGKKPMNLVPKAVTATLKTVATRTREPTAGVADPIGVVSFDPSFSGEYGRTHSQTVVVSLVPQDQTSDTKPKEGNHEIASAISALRDQILAVDHSRVPCLSTELGKDNPIKLSVEFSVSNKSTGGFELKLVAFKFGNKYTKSSEYTQTLDMEFAMSPGATVLAVPKADQ